MTRRDFKRNVRAMVNTTANMVDQRIDGLLASGAVDLKTADMITCRAAAVAFLQACADQHTPWSKANDAHRAKAFRAEVRNMGYYI